MPNEVFNSNWATYDLPGCSIPNIIILAKIYCIFPVTIDDIIMNAKNITDITIVPIMKNILFIREKSLFFCIVFVIFSFILEYKVGVSNFFSCSGSIVSLAGLFLNIKYSLNFHLKISTIELYNKLNGAANWGASEITPDEEKWVHEILLDEMFGISFMIIGTLIWGYGSYFMNLFR